MEHFSYSIILTLFHSFWQLALLLGAYRLLSFHFKKTEPIMRRNFLFVILLLQVISTLFTFLLYYTNFSEVSPGSVWHVTLAALPASFLHFAVPFLTIGYIITIVIKLVLHLGSWQYLNNNAPVSLTRVPVEIKLFTSLKVAEFGITRQVSLWYSTGVHSPVVYGFLKPVILLPVSLATKLTTREIETLLIHEISHIRNDDYLLNWLLIIAGHIYFFNPFMKVLTANIELEREMACDIQVLMFKYTPVEYAAALLTTARLVKGYFSFHLAAVTEKSVLLKRIQYFSHYQHSRRYSTLWGPVMLILLLFITSIYCLSNALSVEQAVIINMSQKIQLSSKLKMEKQNDADIPGSIITMATKVVRKLNEKKELAVKQGGSKNVRTTTNINFLELSEKERAVEFIPIAAALHLKRENESTHEVIINEENTDGLKLTRAYNVKMVNGKWVSEPLWVLSEQHIGKDSVCVRSDSAFTIAPHVQ